MYPRNAASPPRIAVGPVVQISDGSVQTTGVSVVVQPEGGAESAGGGAVAYSAAAGSVLYTPTQAETNHTAFVVTAYKAGCIPASTTIVTSANATAGKVQVGGMDADTVDASALATDAVTEIQNGLSTFDHTTHEVTVGTNNDKTGYSLTPTTGLGDQTANITGNLSGSVGSVTGSVGGNVVGSVGSISGVTFPTNFAALGINVSGHVSRVTLVDTTTTNTDMRGTDSALLAASAPTNFGDMAITATTGYVSLGSVGVNAVTGPNDFKADVTGLALQSTLTTVAGYLDTEIAAILEDTGTTLPGLIATIDGNVDAVKAKTDQFAFTVANQVDANALSGGGGLDAAGVRTAIGMASANMDTQLGNIQIGVDGISVSASPTLLQTTTIATLTSQTSFTLTAGAPDNDAYNTAIAIIVDQATSTQKTVVNISDYIGSTRTVTLSESPKFEITTGDTVYIVATSKTTLTDDVVNSLTGTVTRFVGPVWTGSGWDQDFIKGDSYLGGLAVNITIDNWAGDQLISAASEIKLSGTRTVNGTTTSFEWAVTPGNVTVSGSTTTIPVELTSTDTNITAGEYTADLRATWTSPAETVSLLQPKFKLRVVDPVSTF